MDGDVRGAPREEVEGERPVGARVPVDAVHALRGVARDALPRADVAVVRRAAVAHPAGDVPGELDGVLEQELHAHLVGERVEVEAAEGGVRRAHACARRAAGGHWCGAVGDVGDVQWKRSCRGAELDGGIDRKRNTRSTQSGECIEVFWKVGYENESIV